MTPRAFLSLIIVTGIAVLAAIVVLVSEQIASSAAQRGGSLMFPELQAREGELSQLTIETSRYTLVLAYRDGRWVSVDRGDYPVRSDPILQIVEALTELVAFEPKTTDAALFPEIMVVAPTPETADAGEGAHMQVLAVNGDVLADAIIGKPSASIGQRQRGGTFVRRVGEDQAWLAEGTVLVPEFLPEWFDVLLHVPGPDVGRVAILAGDRLLFDAVKTNFATGDYDLVFLDEAYTRPGIAADDNAVRNMTQAIVTTTFDNARPKDTVTVAADARTVRYETRNGLRLDVTLVMAEGEMWVIYTATAAPGSAAEAQAAAIQASTAQWAFKLPPGRYITLTRDIALLVMVPVEVRQTPFGQGAAPGGPLVPALP